MKIDVKSINKKNTIWRLIYEVIYAPFFEETDVFPQYVLDWCKISKPTSVSNIWGRNSLQKILAVEQGLYE